MVGEKASEGKLSVTESIFKYACIIIAMILIWCVNGFLTFREYCQQHSIYVFPASSLKWCGLGFGVVFIVKYTYFYVMKYKISKIVSEQHEGVERERKIKVVMKLSYDTCYYLIMSIMGYSMFHNEEWFSSTVGGSGSCSAMYDDYPNWPLNKRDQLQIFFMIQLGIRLFSVFETIVIKGTKQRKYYQFLLHHFVSTSLILFSMTSNQVAAGTMILFVHDASEPIMAFSRCFFETIFKRNFIAVAILLIMSLVAWIYFRIIIFPGCLLMNVYLNMPQPTDEWYMIRFQYAYLLWMAYVLVGMHIYWTYFIFQTIYSSLYKKQIYSAHEGKAN